MTTTKTIAKKVLSAVALPLTAALMLTACSDDHDTFNDDINGPWQLNIIVGDQQTAAATGYGLDDAGVTRGNGYTAESQLTQGWQNAGQLNSRNYSRVGLFALTQNGTSVTDASWEKFNVCSNGAEPYAEATLSRYTRLTTDQYEQNQIYYPEVRNEHVDLYAYVPYVTSELVKSQLGDDFTDISTQEIHYTLKQDQTAEQDYVDSDILWGCAGDGTQTSANVTNGAYYKLNISAKGNNNEISGGKYIDFRTSTATGPGAAPYKAFYKKSGEKPVVWVPMLHRAAKIVMRVTTENMLQEKLKNARVRVNVGHIEGLLNIHTGEFTADLTEPANTKSIILTDRLGITAVGETTLTGALKADGTTTTTDDALARYYTCSALVVPQTVTTDFDFLGVDLFAKTSTHTEGDDTDNPQTATYRWAPHEPFTLESGRQYVFDVTVTAQELKVQTTVTDWDAVAPVAKDARQTDALHVGDLYYSDGTYGPYDPTKIPIGVVFQVGTSPKDQALGFKNGYVMALKNANSNARLTEWCANSGTLRTTAITDLQIPYEDTDACRQALVSDMDGLTHCRKAKSQNSNTFNNLTAMKAADDYNSAVATPTGYGASEWYLPSMGQLIAIFCNLGEVSIPATGWHFFNTGNSPHYDFGGSARATTAATNINAALAKCGLPEGTGYNRINANDGAQQDFLSSNEASASAYYDLYLHMLCGIGYYSSKGTVRYAAGATNGDMVRPVLAF